MKYLLFLLFTVNCFANNYAFNSRGGGNRPPTGRAGSINSSGSPGWNTPVRDGFAKWVKCKVRRKCRRKKK